MRLLLFFLLGASAQASWPGKEGVAVPCGTTFDLNDFEQPDVEFGSIKGVDKACTFHITASRGYHVELTCTGGAATANGQDATSFYGEGPVLVVFTPANADSQLFCRAGIEEEHEDMGALHGENGVDTNIKQFDVAFNIQDKKNKEYRAKILAQNIEQIKEINADPTRTWDAGVTNMADKSMEDIVSFYTGLPPPPSQEEQDRQTERTERELLAPLRARRQALPSSVDLTLLGRVSPAKAQESCGSCAAFATVSTIESCMHRETGVLPTDLSEQHLMDCAFHYKQSVGCAGAWPMDYMDWMHEEHNGGLADESDYPYIAQNWGMVERAGTCRNSTVPTANHGAVVTDHYQTWLATEEDIMQLLAEGHSVATSFKTENGYHLYRERVYQHKDCQDWRTNSNHENDRNHAVTIVGYGTDNGVPYWKFKNSWGSGWGKNGFMKILRGVGHCGFAMEFSVPYCAAAGPGPNPNPAPNPPKPSPEGQCGGMLTASKGVLVSEGYPMQYFLDQDCRWDIWDVTGDPKKTVKFTVKDMDVEYNDLCKYDWVEFKNDDGSVISLGDGKAASNGKLCGDIIPAPIFSTTPGAIVNFHSDDVVTKRGFKIEYEIVDAPSCTNIQLHTAIGVQPVTFTTLHYPGDYENMQKCDWTITVPSGELVNLVFETFNTDYNDQVKVFSGPDANSGRLAWLSGRKNGRALEYKSYGNQMHVTFMSDGEGTRKGFRATAEAVRP